MSKEFDKILQDKLSGLQSKPPEGLWSQISSNIPKANAFDQIVGKKLADMQSKPPTSMWNKIAASLYPKTPFFKTTFFRAAALIALISGGVFIATQISDKESISEQEPLVKQTTEESTLSQSNSNSSDSQMEKDADIRRENESMAAQSSSNIAKKEIAAMHNSEDADNAPTTISTNQAQADVSKVKFEIVENKFTIAHWDATHSHSQLIEIEPDFALIPIIDQKEIKLPQNQEKVVVDSSHIKVEQNPAISIEQVADVSKIDTINIEPIEGPKEEAIANQLPIIPKIEPGKLPRNPKDLNKWGVALHISPSLIDLQGSKTLHNDLNISLAFQNVNFKANLGFGFGTSSQEAVYTVDYSRYEFVKIQFVADSLVPVWDPGSQSYVPQVFGHHEKVYDDVNRSYSAVATTQSTWINIPFSMGYIKDFNGFLLSAGAGVNYSLIVSKVVKGMFEPDNQSTIIAMNYPIKTRVQTNISYSLMAGVAYDFNEHFRLSGDFYSVFYQNPIYVDDTKGPFGLGVQMGLTYFFQ